MSAALLPAVVVLLATGSALLVASSPPAAVVVDRLSRRSEPRSRSGPAGPAVDAPGRSWTATRPGSRHATLAGLRARAVAVLVGARLERRVERRLVEVLDALAASLRSGSTARRALEEAAEASPEPFATDLAGVARALAHGEPLDDALVRWSRRRPLPGVRLAVAALTMGARTGGDLARAVEEVAATERHRRATREEVHALSAQARISALVVALAPVAFTGLASLTDPGVARFLLATPLGWLCLVVGLGLDGAGIWWMRAITERVA